MLKKLTTLFILSIFLTACSNSSPQEKGENAEKSEAEGLHVITTFYPIYDFTSKIAGDEVSIKNLVPAGIEPHDYEPSPREIQEVYEADLLIYNGAGVDIWTDNLLEDFKENGVKVLKMSDVVSLLENTREEDHDNESHESEEHHEEADLNGHEDEEKYAEDDHGHAHENSPYDPHFWLDPVLAQSQALAIQDALIELSPEKSATFKANAKNIIEKLKELDKNYKEELQNCPQKKAIVAHDAFGYLENRYGIDLLPISGLSPEEEPSAKSLAELADLSKEHKIGYVFFETLASPKLAETLAQEIGAKTLVLNPIEGLTTEQQSQGEDYFSLMQKNLQNLKLAMECQ